MFRIFIARLIISTILFLPAVAHSLDVAAGGAWEGIFSGKLTNHEVTVSGEKNSYALLTWKLVAKGRTLSSGRQDIRFGSNETVTATLPLQTPPLKPGVSIEAKLIIDLAADGAAQRTTTEETRITIFGPDVLLSDSGFAGQLNIQLFDPDETTSTIFDELGVPYETRSKAQLTKPSETGLIVVGSDVALDRQSGLIDVLLERARAGQRILVLRPASGAFPVTDFSTESALHPSSLAFADDSIVESLAGGLHWAPDKIEQTRRLSLHSHRAAVRVAVAEPGHGSWDWFEINYQRSGGRFIVCMLPFDRYIDQGPVPQIVFIRLLAYASGAQAGLAPMTQVEQ